MCVSGRINIQYVFCTRDYGYLNNNLISNVCVLCERCFKNIQETFAAKHKTMDAVQRFTYTYMQKYH